MFSDLIATGDAEVDSSFANEGGNVGGGEEYQGYGEIFDKRDVEARFAAELDVAA